MEKLKKKKKVFVSRLNLEIKLRLAKKSFKTIRTSTKITCQKVSFAKIYKVYLMYYI